MSTDDALRPPTDPKARALVWVALAGVVGVMAGTITGLEEPWQTTPLLGWDAAALTWVVTVWVRLRSLDAVATGRHATRDDPRRALADALLLGASVTSLIAVLLGISKATNTHGSQRAFLFTWGVVTIVISWAVVQTVYALRYAGLYYRTFKGGVRGGVDFHEEEEPCYTDFAYMSFTIGMTYQVSDTSVQSKEMRRTILRHSLLSFMFGTIIIAATINLAAGLVR